ncbi:hypothetical protein [Cohnella massiliensis]|uniref:hypothetical protein n=1 Tax=Cohnella massiliensis TaxID=1816691 RepID=UPI0011189334|nr:hypothetical protein [Cohnella massiliensis]
MSWFQEVKRLDFSSFSRTDRTEHPEIKTYRRSTINPDSTISVLSQFFLTASALSAPNSLVWVPITNEEVNERTISELTNHFSKIQYIYSDSSLVKIQMQNMLPHSILEFRRLLSDKKLHPIVRELFAKENANLAEEDDFGETATYQVECGKLEPYFDHSFESVWEFIQQSFLRSEGSFIVCPISWKLTNELQHSIALRYFSTKCRDIHFVVNKDTHSVKAVHLSR